MAISETGSVEAEKLAIEQINARRRARPQDQVHPGRRRQRLADLREKAKKLLVNDKCAAVMAADLGLALGGAAGGSSSITACSIIRPSTKPRAVQERHLYRPGSHPQIIAALGHDRRRWLSSSLRLL